MNIPFTTRIFRAGVLVCTAILATTAVCGQAPRALAPPAKPIISLVQDETPGGRPVARGQVARVKGEASFDNAPANFHSFSSVQVGEIANLEQLKLRFSASTQLTRIESTKDFVVEQGSSCVEGKMFAENDTCVLLVRFNPQGAGRRLGRLTITHTASPEPMSLGLGGNGYAPVVSFTPALITTVPASHPSGAGLLSEAQNLTVDGSDSLYIADSGNGIIRYMNSSGTIASLATQSQPLGIAVDNYGDVFFDLSVSNLMYEISSYDRLGVYEGTGMGDCTVSAPCSLATQALRNPGMLSIDLDDNLFFSEDTDGAAMSTVQPVPPDLIYLFDPFPYGSSPTGAFAVDSSDNLYSLRVINGACEIEQQSLNNAENVNQIFTKIAGGTCGFSGDGGQAGNAEIGDTVGQITFDIAGNLYFSDTNNERVRSIDRVTGQINTIAGTGTAGYTGDGGRATKAELSGPTGVAVDSQGQVYIISSAGIGLGQVIRKLGPNGDLWFGTELKGTASAAMTVAVSNVGNTALTLTNVTLTGTNPGDFSIDPQTTSCMLAAGSTLDAGQSCNVGIIFTPAAGGTRSANLVMLDNTVTNSNTVELGGTGTLPAPTFTVTSPASGTSVAAGTAVTFKVSVTSTLTPAPTGTVAMKLDGKVISGSPATLSSGVASLSVTTSVTGPHTLSATYSGDSNYAAAGPISETYLVTAPSAVKHKTTAKLKSSANPAEACKAVTFTATVDGKSGAKPTGEVELWKGLELLGTATLKDGSAKLSTKALAAGTDMLKATYAGDQTHEASKSAELKQVVKEGPKADSCDGAK